MASHDEMGMDVGSDILTLMDDEGSEHQFEVVDSSDLDDKHYVALVPVFDQPEELLEDTGELVILKAVEEDGEEYLEAIEDEDEFNKVSDFFVERLSDRFDFEDNE